MINKLTLGDFQQIWIISKSSDPDEDKLTEIVAIFLGITPREADELSIIEFNQAAAEAKKFLENPIPQIKTKKVIKCRGGSYGINYVPSSLNRGQYVTVLHSLKGDVIENAHKILSVISYDPKTKLNDAKRFNEISEDFKTADLLDVYSSCLFFCQIFEISIKNLIPFLETELMKKIPTERIRGQVRRILTSFPKILDGSLMPNESPILKI